jgi:glycosyltransferase involved in cell wall biosynthesis
MPKVSIIIPAYNQGHYLEAAVKSVLAQTYPDFEAVIVDDGSTDATRQVAAGFKDARVHYIYQENRGLSGARNTGISSTTGEYVTFLDSDDLFLPEKLALLVAVLDEQPEIGLAAGQALLIDQDGGRIDREFQTRLPQDLDQFLVSNPLHVGSVLLRRSWLEKVGLFDESLRACEDWDLWLRLVRGGCSMTCLDQPVSLYRVHVGQMTRDQDRMRSAARRVLDKIYNSPDLPEKWLSMKDLVYSRYCLNSAAHLYRAGDFPRAMDEMREAVRLNPNLAAGRAHELANKISVWAEDVRILEPLVFLRNIYDHLPAELAVLRSRRGQELGQAAMRIAFKAHSQGDRAAARRAAWAAFCSQPRWLANRGALAIFFRSLLAR